MSDRDPGIGYGLTKEAFLGSVPAAIRWDQSAVALEHAMAEALALRPAEIDLLRIYAEIDRLEEPLLSILAYDFKIDWWDPEYTVEQKRKVLRDNWMVHKRLGTRWAVKTSLGAIFPGADVLEWFQYGGTPYCFRIEIPLPEEGTTEERQRRAISRVWYYKNLRSHLESINIQAESTGFLRVGAYTIARLEMEIWPELVSGVEVTGENGVGALSIMREELDIYPELAAAVEVTGIVNTGILMETEQVMEVLPELTTMVEAETQAGSSSITATRQTVEIYPE